MGGATINMATSVVPPCMQSCSQLTRARLLSKCLTALDTSDQCRRIVLGSLDGERALCLLCNLVNLVLLEKEVRCTTEGEAICFLLVHVMCFSLCLSV